MRQRLAARGITLPEGPLGVGAYGDSAALSQSLIALIRSGRKRAGTALLWACEHDGDALPVVGELEVVVDHLDEPALLTRSTRVHVCPFDAVDDAYAAVEGEGDGTLAYWRAGHWEFFTRECERIGRTPTLQMPVVCCEFELLVDFAAERGAPPTSTAG
ncbi:MAG: ASCH domain-containing protein [Rubrivivax sp.]